MNNLKKSEKILYIIAMILWTFMSITLVIVAPIYVGMTEIWWEAFLLAFFNFFIAFIFFLILQFPLMEW